jgi:3-dehydroquinate dehydratase/shikimate dehydrogenase
MNDGKICVSICADNGQEMLRRVEEEAPSADIVELRLDCLPPSEVDHVLNGLAKGRQYLITFRPRAEGGHSDATRLDRVKFWAYALAKLTGHVFFVDYEADIDFPLGLNPDRTIVSIHDFEGRLTDLPFQFDVLARLTGKTIKVAVATDQVTDGIEVWKLLDRADESVKRVIPIAMGEGGKWTRILGLAHGAPLTYAAPNTGGGTAPGQISARDLTDVFRVKELDRDTQVFGVVAGNTSYSMSPFMHNAAFAAAQMNAVFVPLQVGDLEPFIRRMIRPRTREVELTFRGLSVTNPHKQAIIAHLDEIEPTAKAIGAVNTVKIEGDRLIGFNTDADGFIAPLRNAFGDLTGARVAVVGAGGAARACVYALKQAGAEITVLARDIEKASAFAEEFGISTGQLTTGSGVPIAADILVNATPLGTRGPDEDSTVATAGDLRNVKLVYDLVYNPSETRLLREAREAGSKTLGGLEMLIAQGLLQIEIWTGRAAAAEPMRRALENRLQ